MVKGVKSEDHVCKIILDRQIFGSAQAEIDPCGCGMPYSFPLSDLKHAGYRIDAD